MSYNNDIKINVMYPSEQTLIEFLGNALVYGLLGYTYYTMIFKKNAIKKKDDNNSRQVQKNFNDIGGCEEAKDAI